MDERREHLRRRSETIVVAINGYCYRATEWSFGGFLIDADPQEMLPGMLVCIEGIGQEMSETMSVNIHARVVRSNSTSSQVALTSLHLDENAYSVLQSLYD